MRKKLLVCLSTGLLIVSTVDLSQAAYFTADESNIVSGLDDSSATAQDLGTLLAGDQLIVDGAIADNNPDDVDFYKFAITRNASLMFDIDFANDVNNAFDDDTGVDTELAVFNSNNQLLAFNEDSDTFDWINNDPGSLPFGDYDSLITPLPLQAGSYYVAVSSYYNPPLTWENIDYESDTYLHEINLEYSGILIEGAEVGSDYLLSGEGTTTGNYQLVINDLSEVPLPATVWLFGVGLAGLAGKRCRRKK